MAQAVAAVVALLVVLTTAGATTSRVAAPGGPTTAGTPSGTPVRGAPSLTQVQQVLDRHAAAVRTRDAAAFDADLDPNASAAGFRTRAESQFAALSQLPLQSWSYQLVAPITGGQAPADAAARYGTPTLIVRIDLSYALAGIDPEATVHQVWWSFVSRRGRPVIAGDDDLADQGGASWTGPWDFGPLVVRRGTHGLVIAHPDHAALLPGLVADVDAAVPVVTSVWGTGWTQQVALLVPDSTAEEQALSDAAQPLTDVAALAVVDSLQPAADGTQVAVGQRVILDPAALTRLDAIGRRIVLQHEITHVASRAATGSATPTWLVEGFADYVGNLGSGQPVPVAAAELARAVRAGTLPSGLPRPETFTGATAGTTPAEAYEQSWLACRLIAARIGQAGLVRFYRQVGASTDVQDPAVATALHDQLHTTPQQFVRDWQAYLRQELT